ncbi:4'-phosphopantetheinyl transferase family protein [Stieleria varia]|uniref:4'-phosphopantetheinyl transferase sfp n=1 Tax=Stieleria varia TaxID=2528005 RepID=A0A5C5ZXT9_9BACT|nr:4'-phosphopantetheinyl transferase superfamily protein [Stieleria varia]TWT92089.1 4'-phosphopantetheinyl transferase sfp [Stieleria varia]
MISDADQDNADQDNVQHTVDPADRCVVHLYHATTSTQAPGAIEQCCAQWLAPSEIERANQFRRLTNRNQHVVGRGMARRLLGDVNVAPEQIEFDQGTNGKPYVVAPDAAKQPFNIAHTDGLVVCGLGNAPIDLVGVDVERLSRRTSTELAERYFSEPEVRYVRSKPTEEQREAFLKVWTLKESFIKAIGTGLQTPLADFAFREIDSGRPVIEMLSPALRSPHYWQFFSVSPRPGYVGAIAVAMQVPPANLDVSLRCFDDMVTIS